MKGKIKKILKFLFSRKAVIVILLLLQILSIVAFVIFLSEHFAVIYALMAAIGAVTVIFIMNNDRCNPEYKLAWVIPILIIPIFAGLTYILFKTQSETRLFRKITMKKQKIAEQYLPQNQNVIKRLEEHNIHSARLAEYMHEYCNAPVYRNTQVKYFRSGEEKFEQLKIQLEQAHHFIFMEYFIINEGKMWSEILDILIKKVNQGVDVRVLYDGMGSQIILPDRYNKKLESYGIKCRIFNPFRPFLSSVQNNRDHRKIVVIDGHTAFTGGINLADEYINHIERFGHWKDTAVMLKGEAVWSFTMMFLEMWEPELKEQTNYYQQFAPHAYCQEKFKSDGYIMPYGDNPMDNERAGKNVYLNIIHNAEKYVYICTPYLILDHEMLNALEFAAKSGVDVKIITPGIPDKWYTHTIAQSHYKELITHGVEIYEYQKGFIHAKSFVSDDTTAVVGTINLDYRSLYLHFECAAYMYGNSAVNDIKADFEETIKSCHKIDVEYCNKISTVKKVTAMFLKMFAPLL
jgi:cardiolipin synthase